MKVFGKCQKCDGILCCFVWDGANEASEFLLGGGSSNSIIFLVGNKYGIAISPKIVKIG